MLSLKAAKYQPETRAAVGMFSLPMCASNSLCADIVAVIDKSGSMEGEKLQLGTLFLNIALIYSLLQLRQC